MFCIGNYLPAPGDDETWVCDQHGVTSANGSRDGECSQNNQLVADEEGQCILIGLVSRASSHESLPCRDQPINAHILLLYDVLKPRLSQICMPWFISAWEVKCC